MAMVIFDSFLKVNKEAFYKLLLQKNAIMRGNLGQNVIVDADETQPFVRMKDGAGAGWFAIEELQNDRIHLQVIATANPEIKDGLAWMLELTYFILMSIEGKEYADAWINSIPPKGFEVGYTFPVLTDLVLLARELNKPKHELPSSDKTHPARELFPEDIWARDQILSERDQKDVLKNGKRGLRVNSVIQKVLTGKMS